MKDDDTINMRRAKLEMAKGHTTNAVTYATKLSEPLKTMLLMEMLGSMRVMQYDGWGSTHCGGVTCAVDALNCCCDMTEPARTLELQKLHAELINDDPYLASMAEEALLDSNKRYLNNCYGKWV